MISIIIQQFNRTPYIEDCFPYLADKQKWE